MSGKVRAFCGAFILLLAACGSGTADDADDTENDEHECEQIAQDGEVVELRPEPDDDTCVRGALVEAVFRLVAPIGGGGDCG